MSTKSDKKKLMILFWEFLLYLYNMYNRGMYHNSQWFSVVYMPGLPVFYFFKHILNSEWGKEVIKAIR